MIYHNINLLKGVLILFVIASHVLQAPTTEDVLKSFIYSFHMPLFIGISGFLFNIKNAENFAFLDLVNRYSFRLILPWVIATIAFLLLLKALGLTETLPISTLLLNSFLVPYRQLWFIPAFLSWIFLTWFLLKFKLRVEMLLLIGFFVSVISYAHKFGYLPMNMEGLETALNLARPQFFFFFTLGIFLRRNSLKLSTRINIILVLIFAFLTIVQYYLPKTHTAFIVFVLFNLTLMNLSLECSKKNILGRSKILEWIGLNSLAIYLWHVLPLILVEVFVGNQNPLLFYPLMICLEILTLGIIFFLSKVPTINKYFFGLN